MPRELIFDAWTAMSFKRALGNRKQPGVRYESPSWVGEEHVRRLAAYKILQAYVDNSARHFLAVTEDRADDHREYGDAALIRDTVLAALLGDDSEIVVPEAADYSPDSDEGDGEGSEAHLAWQYQEWIREQWDKERGPLKLVEVERDAVGLGDGVYTIGWSPTKKRARIRCWDPGFYFPVVSDGNEDDYPDRVHIAWEVDSDDPSKYRVRRLTWELAPIRPAFSPDATLVDRALGRPVNEELHPGDRRSADGGITRQYAWSDEPSAVTCYYTDATWELDRAKQPSVDDFDSESAIYELTDDGQIANQLDLFIDFLPVVHIPNTVAIKNHYGQSTISKVLQILDDLANSDTDAQAASATAARPVLTIEGGSFGRKAPSYAPGEVWETEGKASLIDTSKSLDAILKYIEFLLGRLSVNARTPDSILGRVKPSEVPSGVALALSFGPLATMIGEMRLSRAEKYPILFRFIHRMSQAGQADDLPPQFFEARMDFGSYLPQDKSAAVEIVTKLRVQRAASLETCVAILVAAGFPIEDAAEEVRRIESRDFQGADDLRTATGSAELALDYLGLDRPSDIQDPAAPPEVIPGDPLTDPVAAAAAAAAAPTAAPAAGQPPVAQ